MDDIVTQPEEQIDFVEYLRLWASPDSNDQAVRDLHKAADEIERLRTERDKWRKVADELYLSGNCSETCVDGAGGYDCSCSWGGAEWEYQQAVRGE